MAEVKKPQDHKKKAEKAEPPEAVFSFEHNGETHTFERATDEALTPGLIRKNRKEDMGEIAWLVIEGTAGADVLDVIDNMSFKDYKPFFEGYLAYIEAYMGASLGE